MYYMHATWCNNTTEAALGTTLVIGGEEDYIQTSNYNTICTICLMYYMCNRSEVSRAKVWRSEGSERSKSGVWCSNTTECYDKHALRADAPIPRMFFSPLVL